MDSTNTNSNPLREILLIGSILLIGLAIGLADQSLSLTYTRFIFLAVVWALFFKVLTHLDEVTDKASLILVTGYLFSGLIEVLSAYSLPSVPGDRSAYLWSVARLMESVSFCLFPLLLTRRIRNSRLFLGYSLFMLFALIPISLDEGLPIYLIRIGNGIVFGILSVSIALLYGMRKSRFSTLTVFLISSGIVKILSVGLLAFDWEHAGLPDLIGRLLGILSVCLIYKAITQNRASKSDDRRMQDERSGEPPQVFELDIAIQLLIDPGKSGAIARANYAACEFYGYSTQELEGMSITDLDVLPAQEVLSLLAAALDQKLRVIHARHLTQPGAEKDVEIHIRPTEVDSRVCLYAIIFDETSKLLAEARLRESEEMYRRIADNVTDVVWITDLEFNPTYISPSVERVYGITPEAFLQLPITRTYPQTSLKKFAITLEQQMAKELDPKSDSNRVFTLEVERYRPDGTIGWDAITAKFIRDPEGTPVAILGTSRDISEQKATEEALRQSQQRFKALHNASFGGITIHDKGVIIECNQGLSDITGYAIEELIGMDGLLLIAQEYRAMVRDKIRSGYEKAYEAYGLRKDGQIYPIRLEARNIPYKGKEVRVVEFRDITEQKRAEQENRILQDKLLQSQKMDAVGRLAGGVAHDFNNMLSVIIGYADLILARLETSDPIYSEIEEILGAAQRSAGLTQQLLAFSRKQAIIPTSLDMNLLIKQTLNMLTKLIGEDINLSWEPCPSRCMVLIDASQLNQILVNLCINARDAIVTNGAIHIGTRIVTADKIPGSVEKQVETDEYVLLTVSDDGCGMDKETMDKMFEPFFTQKGEKGTGLGLSTVYGIVTQNKGFIHVTSEKNAGTTISIYLPHQVDTLNEKKLHPKQDSFPASEYTILLVDDEAVVRDMVTAMLKQLGYRVLIARSPQEAIELAHTHQEEISLLMSDVVMPEMNGRELSEELMRQNGRLRTLFMSGYTSNVIEAQGVLGESSHFIQKPFSIQEIREKIHDILNQ